MSKVSREKAAENRSNVVAAASALFRIKGIDGVGIRELMGEVGLTQGGFTGQFGSKDALAGEACTYAFDSVEVAFGEVEKGDPAGRLHRLASFYFSPKPPGYDCPMATLAVDAARAPAGSAMRRTFTVGLRRLADIVAGKKRDDRALIVMAAMVGASVLGRASDDPLLAVQFESAVLRFAGGVDPQMIRSPRDADPTPRRVGS